MTRLHIDRIALKLHGISSQIAQSAIEGLDTEIVRRLHLRGLDAAALSELSPTLRLPTINSATALDAESLRAHIVDGFMSLLPPENTSNAATDIRESV
jgi:hypothetical protein